MRHSGRTLLVFGVAWLAAVTGVPLTGQQAGARPAMIAVNGTGDALLPWSTRVDEMLSAGTLEVHSVQADTLIAGRTHERLDQLHEGLPVFGGQLVRQQSGSAVLTVMGRIFENVSVATTRPSIDATRAREIAERHLGDGAIGEEPRLGILPETERYVLVYRFVVRGTRDIRRYDVNAVTGAIEAASSQLRHQSVVGRGVGVLGDTKKVVAQGASGGFQTVDRMRPATQGGYAFDGSISRLVQFLINGVVFDSDLGFSSTNQWDDAALVDMHAYAGWTYDYYYKTFGRRGLDDRNFPVTTIVHPIARALAFALHPIDRATFVNNAFYLHPGHIVFGDGDGVTFDYFGGALDVVAHELSHGVTAFTSDLEYEDEPGALNEAFSDIIGTSAEFFHLKPGGPQKGPNWVLAEDVTRSGPGYIRSMENPTAAGDPDHYSIRQFIGTDIDNGGVHVNSGIVNHAFYLAVHGGRNRVSGISVTGIGDANIQRMARVFYRGFTFFLSPFSQFSDARAATLQAATDLYGASSNERAQLLQAWTAVGVN